MKFSQDWLTKATACTAQPQLAQQLVLESLQSRLQVSLGFFAGPIA